SGFTDPPGGKNGSVRASSDGLLGFGPAPPAPSRLTRAEPLLKPIVTSIASAFARRAALCPKSQEREPMPDTSRQISTPRDLGEGSISGDESSGTDKGEAWMRICLRLRAELGEEVFSSWFRCLELDGLSDGDASLSVPTKFLQSWIRSHYADRILPTLAAEFPAVKRISINVRSSARPAVARVAGGIRHLSSCSIVDPAKGRTSTPLPPPSPVAMPGNTLVASKRTSMSQ